MLITIQFPFADLRGFLEETTGKLDAPGWPYPEPNEFVRFFGGIKRRRRGGTAGWAAESTICDISDQLRFSQTLPVLGKPGRAVRMRCPYRRLYFYGPAAGKFEIGIATERRGDLSASEELRLSRKEIDKLLKDFVATPVRIRKPKGFSEQLPIIRAGYRLTDLYLLATTAVSYKSPSQEWWVRPGTPLLFLETRPGEQVDIPYYVNPITLPERLKDTKLSHCYLEHGGMSFPMWIMSLGSTADRLDARLLRLYLLRLHAEHECLRIVLKEIAKKHVAPAPKTSAAELLNRYFEKAFRYINRLELQTERQYDLDIAEVARHSIDQIRPEEVSAIREGLTESRVRFNYLRNALKYAELTSNLPAGTTVNLIGEVNTKEVTMGNKDEQTYNVDRSPGSAFGPNAHSHVETINQTNAEAGRDLDFTNLVPELERLREAMLQQSTDSEHYVAVAEVAKAKEAAETKDGGGVLEALKGAGEWALRIASDIGTRVAVEALKRAIGLP